MRRFTFPLAFAVALLLLSAAVVSPQAAAAQTIPACDPNALTQIASVNEDGQTAPMFIYSELDISYDGRYIGFVTYDNLDPGTEHFQVKLRDRLTCQTEVVSLTSDETTIADAWGYIAVSFDARFVAFDSPSSGIDPQDNDTVNDVYVRDRLLGVTTLASINPDGQKFTCRSVLYDMSDDGRFVLFLAEDSQVCWSGLSQLYVRDLVLNTTELVSVSTQGDTAQFPVGGRDMVAEMSADGSLIVFDSPASNLVPNDTNNTIDIFVRNRQTGETTLISHNNQGEEGNGSSHQPRVTDNGRFITFTSTATNLMPGGNSNWGTYLYDRQSGSLDRLVMDIDGLPYPADGIISDDGRYITYTFLYQDRIFVVDRQTGALVELPPVDPDLPTDSTMVFMQAMSGDGRHLVYTHRINGWWIVNPPVVYIAEWQRLLPPAAPTPLTPTSALPVTQPTFTWNTVTDGAWYYLWVTGADGHVLDQWYDAWNICTGDTCSVTPPLDLPTGQYQWWVQAWSPYGGYGAWNSGAAFTVTVPPAAPTISAPTGVIVGNQPTYRWNSVPGASWYDLWVSDESGFVLDQWYDGSTICAAGECAVTPPVPLDGGLQRVWVQAWSPYGGYSAWSAEAQFAVAPSAPTPFAPVGTVAPEVAFQWTPVQGGAWYYVWLSNDAGKVFDTWFSAADHCGGAVCATQLMPLPAGNYRWWVQAWSPYGGYGAWSGQADFSIAAPMPEEVTPPEVAPPEVQVGGL